MRFKDNRGLTLVRWWFGGGGKTKGPAAPGGKKCATKGIPSISGVWETWQRSQVCKKKLF